MGETHDDLEVRRWFRRRLEALGTEYPQLKHSARQERLRDALAHQTEEDMPCHGDPPASPEDGPQAPVP